MSHSVPTGSQSRTPCQPGLLADHLAGTRWSAPEVYPSVGSTNAEAMTRPVPGRVLVADHQSQGRGRLARVWEAPPGAAVAVSAVLPLPPDESLWAWVPLLAGAAVRDALADRVPHLGLKWPNDILARAAEGDEWRKLVGILCQTTTGPDGAVVVIGVGINTDLTAAELPVETATSLRLLDAPVTDVEALLAGLLCGLADLEKRLQGGGPALAERMTAYRRGCVTLGREVRVELPDRMLTGTATAVDEGGRLVLRNGSEEKALAVGDVVHVRARGRR